MKKVLYISFLWIAILMVLLSTVVPHHHHLDQVCTARERCIIDGNINDRHTEHSESEDNGCFVQQMHTFVVNAKIVRHIFDSLIPCFPILSAVLANKIIYSYDLVSNAVEWPDISDSLIKVDIAGVSRRGPPLL